MMGWYPSGWGAMGAVGMVIMLAVWASLIIAAVWFIARLTHTDRTPPRDTGRAILDRRFASGELSPEEYASARRTLESPGTTTSSARG